MASESLVNRLEAAVAQIEALVPKLGAKARGGGGGGDDEEEVPEFVTEYETVIRPSLAAVSAAADAAGVKAKGLLDSAFDCLGSIIKASAACKKPQPQDWGTLLKGASDAISAFDKAAFKRPKKGCPDLKDHYTGLKEFVTAFNWVTMQAPQLPAPYVQSAEGSVMFSFNKLLRLAKDASNGDQLKALVKNAQAAMKALYAYVKKYFKTGLEWNAKGSAVADFTPGASKPAAAAPAVEEKEPEAAPAPKKGKKTGGLANVFGQLNKMGEGMGTSGAAASAFGLKKVTREMRTDKNPALKASGLVKAQPKKAKRVVKKSQVKKIRPPSAVCKANRWMVEYYRDNAVYKLPEEEVKVKHTVFITGCESACIQVPLKVKSVMIDSCTKCKIFVNEVISSVELINCKSVTLIVQTKAPSIAVDKSQSPRIILLRPAYDADPAIITSNISAMNIEIPGATDEADTIELPVPEQFITKINKESSTLVTEEVKHG